MTVKAQASGIIDQPVSKVFQFHAVEHVQNHPRWDSDIELWLESDNPIGDRTIIKRRNSRSGTPVEETMEVTEYEPDRTFCTLIHDDPVKTIGRVNFESLGDSQTKVALVINLPDMAKSMDTSFLMRRLEETAEIRKNSSSLRLNES